MIWVALLTDEGEVTAPEYKRQVVVLERVGAGLVNIRDVCFPEATSTWGTITRFVFYDDAGRSLIEVVHPPLVVSAGTNLTFQKSSISLQGYADIFERLGILGKPGKTAWERLLDD